MALDKTVTASVETYLLTSNQKRLWFLQNLSTNDHPLVVSSQIEGDFDPDQLAESLDELLAQFWALGMVVSSVNGSPQAHIRSFDVADILGSERLPDEATLSRRIQQLRQQPFDLEAGPLLRITSLSLPTQQTTILIVAHQLILGRHGLQVFSDALGKRAANGAAVSIPDDAGIIEPSISDENRAWWQQQLDAIAPLEFPIDKVRPPVQVYKRYACDLELDTIQSEALASCAASQNCSIETVLLAAFAALLHRYTGSDDLIFGLSTQPAENLVPLRLPLGPTITFADLIERVRDISKTSLEHQMPFASLLESVVVERDLSRAPLVQIAFGWAGDVANGLPMVEADLLDLQLVSYQRESRIHFRFEYDGAIFEQDSIERIAEHFRILLVSAMNAPQNTIIDLPLMSDEERELVLVSWNDTTADYPQDQCLHQLIEAQVQRTPTRIAAISGDDAITYDALNRRANQLAHYLQTLGIGPDDLVGVHLERTLDMLVTVLAVMKAGGGYVPLDPSFPQDRLRIIAEDARIKILITHSVLKQQAPEHGGETIVIDEIQSAINDLSADNPTSSVQPGNLVYVIFTSGSTGRPKGVQIEHRSAVNFLTSMQAEPGLSEGDVLLAVTTLSFDIAVLELYLPLLTGAKVVIASYEDVLDGRRLLELIERHGITLLQATPATWQLMLEAGWQQTPDLTALCGGEALPLALAQQIVQRCKALWNMYGPTETTVWSSVEPIREVRDFISIGHPINNTTIYVLDAAGKPAPIGVPGELVIGGDGLARGYFERPDLTAEKYIPDPFIEHTTLAHGAAPRMYRTGDIARYLADGRLQFYGRIDHQVKVRGFRIELGEIETVLGNHEAIKQVVVVVREDTPGNKQIVAYLVLHEGKSLNQSELRDHVKIHLPNYMVPAVFVALDKFPLTPNGKINRQALPKPELEEYTTATEYVAPRNEVEAKLAAIWADALNMPKVGIQDNFFDLGGHSLLAIRIFSQISRVYGKELPLATLFRTPTIEELAALLEGGDEAAMKYDVWSPVVPVQPGGHRPPFFCVGGGVVNMQMVSRYLGKDIPFYALQTEGLDAKLLLRAEIPTMAGQMIAEIRKVQSKGPYYLGGAYGSAVVTLEMASQLRRQGEQVGTLVAFNLLPGRKNSSLQERALHILSSDGKQSESGRFKFLAILKDKLEDFSWQHFAEYLMDKFWHVAYKGFRSVNRPMPRTLRKGQYVEALINYAARDFELQEMYDRSVNLIISDLWYEMYGNMQPYWGWDSLVSSDIHSHRVPGDPCSMFMDPNAEVLAGELRQILLAAHQEQAKA